jgi:hypothetical protein
MKRRAIDQFPAADPRLMLLPVQGMLMMQAAVLRAWEPWLRYAAHLQQQMSVCQKEFFSPHSHLRHHDVCSAASDLKDHYGRRTGDVEVERI